MAFVVADRVKESSTTTGTGTFGLGGAPTGYRTFVSGIGGTNSTTYCIQHRTQNEWEVGIGTVTDSTPDTITRSVVLASSNAGLLVDFSAGPKDVYCTHSARKAVYLDASDRVALGIGVASYQAHVFASSEGALRVESSATGSLGPSISLYHNSATPAVDDIVGSVYVHGEDHLGNEASYSRIYTQAKNVTDGSEAAQLVIQVCVGGSLSDRIIISSLGLVGIAIAPTSTLHVGGSLATAQLSVAGDTVLTSAHHTLWVDSTAASRTITLPAASTCLGREYVVFKSHAPNQVILDGDGSETINGAPTVSLVTQYSYLRVKSNGTGWYIVGSG
jgi:hypothetical protein